jgi:diacylglycerol kinase (ATP)
MPDGISDALLIYNLASGRRRERRFAEIEQAVRVLKEAGIAVELAPTKGAGTATGIARNAVALRRGMVIACGGDGTINEIINGLAGSRVPMALLPAGTANILAKELGIPWDIPHAARLISGGSVKRIALGLAVAPDGRYSAQVPPEGRYFLCVAGAGPDGALVHAVNNGLKSKTGQFAYWAEGARQLLRYDFPEIRIRWGGEERVATLVVVGRTVNYGGPFKITTGASLHEDCFELLTNSSRRGFHYLACLPALWVGKLRSMKGIDAWKCPEIVCDPVGEAQVYAQVDGEPIGTLPLCFRIVPDALSLVIPPSTP